MIGKSFSGPKNKQYCLNVDQIENNYKENK